MEQKGLCTEQLDLFVAGIYTNRSNHRVACGLEGYDTSRKPLT
jgi:hypothetical protein